MSNASFLQPLRQNPAAKLNMILIAPAAIDKQSFQAFQIFRVARDQVNWIVLKPTLPAYFKLFSSFHIKRDPKAVRCVRIGGVTRRHAQVHEAVDFRAG